jgi:hypothetical protein
MTTMICDHSGTCDTVKCEDHGEHESSPNCTIVCPWHKTAKCIPVEPEQEVVISICDNCAKSNECTEKERKLVVCANHEWPQTPPVEPQPVATETTKQTAWESLKAKLLNIPEPEAFKEWLQARDLKLAEAVLDKWADIGETDCGGYNWREYVDDGELEQFIAEWGK